MEEEPSTPETPETAAPESTGAQAGPEGRSHEERAVSIDATAVVLTSISLLASKAWEAMGLVPDPATKRISRRLEDAQLAIDAAAALADLIRGKIGEPERRDLDNLLMNLRLNFVEQRAKG